MAFLTGAGVLSYALLLLGLFGGFTENALLVFTLVAMLPSCLILFKERHKCFPIHLKRRYPSIWYKLSVYLTVIFIGMAGFRTILPCVNWDAWVYHLNIPSMYLIDKSIGALPGTCYSQFPFSVDLLFLFGLWAGNGETLVHLIAWTFYVCLIISAYRLSKHLLGQTPAATITLIVSGLPLISRYAPTAMVDIAFAAYILAVLRSCCGLFDPTILNGAGRRSAISPRIGVSALLAGFSAGTKLTGLLIIPAMCCGILFQKTGPLPQRIKKMFIFLLLALLIASPWYIKAEIQEGNPIFPFAYSLFGGKHWSQSSDLLFTRVYNAEHLRGIRGPIDFVKLLADTADHIIAATKLAGIENDVAGICILVILIILMIIAGVILRRTVSWRKTIKSGLPVCFILSSSVFILLSSLATRQPRFHLVTQIMLVMLIVSCVMICLREYAKPAKTFATIATIILVVTNGAYALKQSETVLAYALDGFNRRIFIAANGPMGRQLMEIKPYLPVQAHVLSFWDPAYPLRTKISLANPFQQGDIPWLEINTTDKFKQILNKRRITHVLYFPGFLTNDNIAAVSQAAVRSNVLVENLVKAGDLTERTRSYPLILYEFTRVNCLPNETH